LNILYHQFEHQKILLMQLICDVSNALYIPRPVTPCGIIIKFLAYFNPLYRNELLSIVLNTCIIFF
jgi:hypothetical protein